MLHQATEIFCAVSGNPFPNITWYKDGVQLFIDQNKMFVEDDNQKLTIFKPDENDSGIYSCSVANAVGHARKDTELSILSKY